MRCGELGPFGRKVAFEKHLALGESAKVEASYVCFYACFMLDPTRQFWKISPPTLCLVNQDPRQDCKNPVYGIIPWVIKVWWGWKRWIDPTLPLAKKSSLDVKMKVIHIFTFLRLILQWQSRHLVYTSRFWLMNTWNIFQHLQRAAIQNFAHTISNPTVTVIIKY